MTSQLIIFLAVFLSAAIEAVSNDLFVKEMILATVFFMGMWQDRVLYHRDKELADYIAKKIKGLK